jgi:hypothetical protein
MIPALTNLDDPCNDLHAMDRLETADREVQRLMRTSCGTLA